MATIDRVKAYEARRRERDRTGNFQIIATLVHAYCKTDSYKNRALDLIALAAERGVTVCDLIDFLEQQLGRLDSILSKLD